MAECVFCRFETEFYDGEMPICVVCSNSSPESRDARAQLVRDLIEAAKRTESATEVFTAVTDGIPNGVAHPDGQRIMNASLDLSNARDSLMEAHRRLNNFIENGIFPEDLKLSG